MGDFITLCAQGHLEVDDIDDFIDLWNKTPDHPLPLHTYLGFSAEDYNVWLLKPEFIHAVIADKKKNLGLIKN